MQCHLTFSIVNCRRCLFISRLKYQKSSRRIRIRAPRCPFRLHSGCRRVLLLSMSHRWCLRSSLKPPMTLEGLESSPSLGLDSRSPVVWTRDGAPAELIRRSHWHQCSQASGHPMGNCKRWGMSSEVWGSFPQKVPECSNCQHHACTSDKTHLTLKFSTVDSQQLHVTAEIGYW